MDSKLVRSYCLVDALHHLPPILFFQEFLERVDGILDCIHCGLLLVEIPVKELTSSLDFKGARGGKI